MAALDDDEDGAADKRHQCQHEHGATWQITFEPKDGARRRFAIVRGFHAFTIKAKIRAQQHDRANGWLLQVSLRLSRSPGSSGARCTIHCTSPSITTRKYLRGLAQMALRSCRHGRPSARLRHQR